MDTEQLKMLLEMVREAGAGAKDVAIAYFVSQAITPILTAGTVITVAVIIAKLIKHVSARIDGVGAAWKAICDAAGCYHSEYHTPDHADIQKVIEKLKAKS